MSLSSARTALVNTPETSRVNTPEAIIVASVNIASPDTVPTISIVPDILGSTRLLPVIDPPPPVTPVIWVSTNVFTAKEEGKVLSVTVAPEKSVPV